MRRYFLLLFVCLCAVASVSAQTVDATVCDILSNPQSFDGKIVRIKGTVLAGFDEFVVKDANCKKAVNAIWLAYPEGTNGSAGPTALAQLKLAKNSPATVSAPNRTPVKLDKNKDFKQFDSLLATPYKGDGMCLGCMKYTVTATLTGRIDGVSTVGASRDSSGKFIAVNGFGNMNLYPTRLVLQSVADVVSQEIDYSKAAAETKGDTVKPATGPPVAAGHNVAKVFPAGSTAALQIESAAAAYGKPGENTGVFVGFGTANEVPKNDGEKGSTASPDGLLVTCTFDMERLKGDSLSKAIVHIGTHIADIRGTNSDMAPAEFESRAWQTTVLAALGSGQKTLTAPGGYVLWDAAWPHGDRTKNVEEGITRLLTNWTPFAK